MSTLGIWRNSGILCLGLAVAFGLALFIGLLLVMGAVHTPDAALAQGPNTRYVDSATGNDSGNYCTNSGAPCATIQHAVDVADPGDEIRVATGIYTDVQGRPVPAGYPSPPASGIVTQVVYISQTVTIRGGYTTTNGFADPPAPEANPTTLDALGQGRVLFIAGDPSVDPGKAVSPTVEGLRVTGGNAYWLGGGEEDSLYRGAGGGVYVVNATATLSDCWLFGNDAYYGGGLYLYESDATLSNNTVSSNTVYNGGGLYLHDSDATLSGNTVTANSAYNGGGLRLSGSNATLSDNIITANTAHYSGGGLYLHGSTATLSGNTVLSNTARGTGGGLHLGDSDVTLSSNTISSNTVNWDGGGLYLWDSAATLNDNDISFNTARYGGGLRLYNNSPATTLSGNTVSSNTAYYGGGLCLHGSAATLNDNTISSNTAYTSGGGLYLGESAATLNGNIVLSNTAIYSGGGLYLQYSDATLINNVVADNRVNSTGSGLHVEGSSPHLLHTTIARNTGGDGSGVYVITGPWGGRSAVALTNTILVSHTVGITVAADNTATLNGVLWYSNTINYGGEGTITVTNEYTGNPAFAADGYHLTASSEAIDRGVNAGVDDDIDGDPRPIFTTVTIGTGYDLGADEFPAALSVTKQADSDPVQAGAQLTYTLRVANTGNVTLTATVTDILPTHVTPTEILTWTPVTITTGGVWMQTVVVTAKIGYSGTLTNVVQVTTAEGATGIYTETSTAEVTHALDVTKQADPDPVTPGSPLTYTIRVTNTGNVTLTATITDILPQHVTPTGIQVWTETITAPGGVWTEQFTVTAKIGYSGTLTNVVQVTTDQGATGIYTKTATVVGYSIYLPVILK